MNRPADGGRPLRMAPPGTCMTRELDGAARREPPPAAFLGTSARQLMNDRDREGSTVQGNHAAQAPAATDLGANSAIGRKLKAFYDDVASEPVPDRFLSLLDALDRAEQSAKRARGEQEGA
jgi:hypothetical protein